MRIGVVRNDLGHGVYLTDVESRVQRCFSVEPPGQSRTLRKPTDAELTSVLDGYGVVSVRGTDNNANVNTAIDIAVTATDAAADVDTTINDTIRIKTAAIDAFIVIPVTAGAVTAKTTIRDDINAAIALAPTLAGKLVASVAANQLVITGIGSNVGPSARIQIDSVANGSTLNTAVGYAVGGVIATGSNISLRIKTAGANSFTVITPTQGAVTAKTTILAELNAAFLAADIPFIASIPAATNKIQIDTIAPNLGPSATLVIDTAVNLSLLNAILGFNVLGVSLTGLSLAALKAGVYTGATTIDVSTSNIATLGTFTDLTTAQKAALQVVIADLVAPYFVETPPVMLSFTYGVVSKLRSAAYRPDGARTGYATGKAVAVLEDDGSTVFTFP